MYVTVASLHSLAASWRALASARSALRLQRSWGRSAVHCKHEASSPPSPSLPRTTSPDRAGPSSRTESASTAPATPARPHPSAMEKRHPGRSVPRHGRQLALRLRRHTPRRGIQSGHRPRRITQRSMALRPLPMHHRTAPRMGLSEVRVHLHHQQEEHDALAAMLGTCAWHRSIPGTLLSAARRELTCLLPGESTLTCIPALRI